MIWVFCVRADLPEDAPPGDVAHLAGLMEPLIAPLEHRRVGYLNLALSAAAVVALRREGYERLLLLIREAARRQRIQLIATAAHGALLPLLPADELDRQLDLNDEENRKTFGDLYRPMALWSPALAYSPRMGDAAVRRGLSMVLVDEAAMRTPPGGPPSTQIDADVRHPGLFLLPCSRAVARALATGAVRTPHGLRGWETDSPERSYRMVALELGPRTAPTEPWAHVLVQRATASLRDLDSVFPLAGALSPQPCSARSSTEELGGGLAFAAWFDPANPIHALQWRLAGETASAVRTLFARGLSALPDTGRLRAELDLCWRESWWRAAGESFDPPEVLRVTKRLEQACADVLPLLPDDQAQELRELPREIRAEIERRLHAPPLRRTQSAAPSAAPP